jgi:hypothetical protein
VILKVLHPRQQISFGQINSDVRHFIPLSIIFQKVPAIPSAATLVLKSAYFFFPAFTFPHLAR